MASSAMAADLPVRAPVVPPPPLPVCIWCGFYVGVNGGGAWTRSQSLPYLETNLGAFNFAGEFGPLPQRSGPFAGGQAGINWQWGMFVAGAELDAQAARISSAVTTTITPYLGPGTFISIATQQRIDYFGTARGRLGIAFGAPGWGPGTWGSFLVYATGGFAYAGVRDGFAMISNGDGDDPTLATNFGSNGRIGAAAGAGVEWMFLPNWSLKGEYQYIALKSGPRVAVAEFTPTEAIPFVLNRTDP
ncbi:MAG: outer membrane beta-barrel protein, partial [Methylobacteriaceae bacterium]|nr:outer membrane beta-barrel protein [Methylobacteriaceae bacterium]